VFGEMLDLQTAVGANQEAPGQRQALLAGKGRGYDQHRGAADRILFVRGAPFMPSGRKRRINGPNASVKFWLSVQGGEPGVRPSNIRPGLRGASGCTFHTSSTRPFYVYAYAFWRLSGELALLRSTKNAPKRPLPSRYLAMLSAGGTKALFPSCLKPFGLDARNPKFWDGGFVGDRRYDRRAGRDGLIRWG